MESHDCKDFYLSFSPSRSDYHLHDVASSEITLHCFNKQLKH